MPEIEIQRHSEVVEIEEREERINYKIQLDKIKKELAILRLEISKMKKMVKEG
jgi:hypothetical protein